MTRGHFVGRCPQLSSDRTAIIERGMAHVRFSKGVLLNGSDGSFASGSGRPPLQAMSVMPRKRRSATKMRSVAMGQLRTHAPQQTADYVKGAGTVSGYFSVTPSKDSTLWIKVDGTAKPEGITTVFPEAPAIVVGGTGRFEGAKGDGKFLGGVRLTPLAAGADYWNEFVINVKK